MAELGYHPATPGSTAHSNDLVVAFLRVQAAENGDVTAITAWPATASTRYTLGIYADSSGLPGALLSACAGATSPGSPAYQSQNINSSVSIVSGTWYWLACQSESQLFFGQDTATNTSYFIAGTYSHGNLPNPFGSGTSFADVKFAIFATYTPAAAAGTALSRRGARARRHALVR